VEEANSFAKAHGVPFNYEGWRRIAAKGFLPVKIRAVPEGRLVPTKNILMSVESTDPEAFWVASWLETMLVRVWLPTTIATADWYTRNFLDGLLGRTCDDPASEIGFKLHDFGGRGATCQEHAMIGGAAHLVNFLGSDTIAGVWAANKYYNHEMAGFSIPATEHSTMTAWGRDGEEEAFRNVLDQYLKKDAIVACVSDSYDIWNAIDNIWGDKLKKQIQNSGGILVVRPDSGDPFQVSLTALKKLENAFGSYRNTKNFKVLNNVRLIYGDGMNREMIQKISNTVVECGFSMTNICFGMGGGLLQNVNRDTCKFAFKCSSMTVGGKEREIWKDPITDRGKLSKRGRLDLVEHKSTGRVKTTNESFPMSSLMLDVFEDGKILKEWTLEEVRENARKLPWQAL
jgi:nicotinamide phosphoribosyltransferase